MPRRKWLFSKQSQCYHIKQTECKPSLHFLQCLKIIHFYFSFQLYVERVNDHNRTWPQQKYCPHSSATLKSLPNSISESIPYGFAHKSHHLFPACHLQWFHSHLYLINSLHSIQGSLLKYKLVLFTFLLTKNFYCTSEIHKWW